MSHPVTVPDRKKYPKTRFKHLGLAFLTGLMPYPNALNTILTSLIIKSNAFDPLVHIPQQKTLILKIKRVIVFKTRLTYK